MLVCSIIVLIYTLFKMRSVQGGDRFSSAARRPPADSTRRVLSGRSGHLRTATATEYRTKQYASTQRTVHFKLFELIGSRYQNNVRLSSAATRQAAQRNKATPMRSRWSHVPTSFWTEYRYHIKFIIIYAMYINDYFQTL